MNKIVLNHRFYKTINFWLGLLFVVTDIYPIVKQSSINFNFWLNIIDFAIGVALLLSGLFKKIQKPSDGHTRDI